MKKLYSSLLSAIAVSALIGSSSARAEVIDWDKIEHWAGEGSNRAALVIQFADGGPEQAYVWGYRWNDEDYENGTPTGEEMFRAIVAGNNDLLLFTQFTGSLGSTVDGIGYFDPTGTNLASVLAYDFNGAKEDSRVSFDYFSPNELMGQTKAPGNFTSVYCKRAIAEAINTRIIEHPINAREYGYPAYDYDWWQPTQTLDTQHMRWHAGWYDGYWSYWVGNEDITQLSYSGLGYSSRKISNNGVDGWKYMFLDGPVTGWDPDGFTGASEPWHKLNYNHFNELSTTESVEDDAAFSNPEVVAVFTLSGKQLQGGATLSPGFYIVQFSDGSTKKLLMK